jgi:hypothetical protein
VSNAGVPLSPFQDRLFGHIGKPSSVALLATRDGRVYLRFVREEDGAICYGAGEANGALGIVSCPRDFPSAKKPIEDFSGGWSSHDGTIIKLTRVEGIAADGVASVALRTTRGDYVARSPVVANVYAFQSPPVASTLVAFAANGTIVYEKPL